MRSGQHASKGAAFEKGVGGDGTLGEEADWEGSVGGDGTGGIGTGTHLFHSHAPDSFSVCQQRSPTNAFRARTHAATHTRTHARTRTQERAHSPDSQPKLRAPTRLPTAPPLHILAPHTPPLSSLTFPPFCPPPYTASTGLHLPPPHVYH